MKKSTKISLAAGAITVAILAALYGISWIVTCGIIKAITLCFGWEFTWGMATGIWLIICLLKGVFSHNVTVKK